MMVIKNHKTPDIANLFFFKQKKPDKPTKNSNHLYSITKAWTGG